MSRPGLLICLEGIDASGKSTQARLLADSLRPSVRLLKFPDYGTALGREIRECLKGMPVLHIPQRTMLNPEDSAQILAMMAEVRQWRLEGLVPAATLPTGYGLDVTACVSPTVLQAMMTVNRLEQAHFIRDLLDRGVDVILDRYWPSGYAYGAADGANASAIRLANAVLPQPDVCILVKVNPEVALSRRPKREDAFEADTARVARASVNYEDLWREMFAVPGWLIVPGEQPVEDVHLAIVEAVAEMRADREERQFARANRVATKVEAILREEAGRG